MHAIGHTHSVEHEHDSTHSISAARVAIVSLVIARAHTRLMSESRSLARACTHAFATCNSLHIYMYALRACAHMSINRGAAAAVADRRWHKLVCESARARTSSLRRGVTSTPPFARLAASRCSADGPRIARVHCNHCAGEIAIISHCTHTIWPLKCTEKKTR